MNIVYKFNQGGMPSLVSFTPVQLTPPQIPTEEQKELPQLLDFNMLKLLSENALPSDMEEFIDSSNLFTNNIFNSFNKNASITLYKILQKTLPRLKLERDRYYSALKRLEENDGLNEIAVDGNYVYAKDSEGNIKKKDISLVNFDNELLLTNVELLTYRANDKNAAFKTNITNIAANGVGISKIIEKIQQVTNKLGTTSVTREGYISLLAGKLVQGLDYIKSLNLTADKLSGMSMDGIYKANNMESSQIAQANLAIKHLMGTLPKEMITVLRARAAERFGDSSLDGAEKLIALLINSQMNTTSSFTLDYNTSLNKTEKSSNNKSGVDLGPAETLLLGMGESKIYPINMGTADTMNVKGYASLLVDKDGNSIARGTLQDVIGGLFGSTLDWDNISMGNNMINPTQANKIALNGNKIIAADLPIDLIALRKGEIKPDLNMLLRKEKADEYIRQHNIKDKNLINLIYASQEYNLPIMYDSNGQLVLTNYKRFGIISGFADAKAFNTDVEDLNENNLLKEVDDDNLMESIVQTLTMADKNFTSSLGWWGDSNTYLGSIFIPMTDNVLMTSLGSKNYYSLPNKTAQEVYAQLQLEEKRLGYVKPTPFSKL